MCFLFGCFFCGKKGGEIMEEQELNDFQNKWEKVIDYATGNNVDIPDLIEELTFIYHLDDHLNKLKEKFRDEVEYTQNVFGMLYTHCAWDKKHALEDALIHAHMEVLNKDNKLTLEMEKKLKLNCSECSKCFSCGKKVNKKNARYITSNQFCERFCEEKGDLIIHRKGCRYYGQ